MNFKINVFIFVFLFSLNVSANEQWAIDCDSGKGRITFKESKADMVVNSNQILVSAKVVRSNDRLSFFLDEPTDLGRGGMMLNWDDFSKKKPIADAVISSKKISLSWKGFFEESTSKYVWISDSDFSSSNSTNKIVVNRCE